MRQRATRAALSLWIGLVLAGGFGLGEAHAAARDVQIVAIDFETQIIELYNFGPGSESLSGWRFCSHNSTMTFRYSGSLGLNGVSIGAGSSLYIHFANDAPAEAGHLNRSALGGNFALPLDRGPYGLSLYFAPVNFNIGTTMADHVQWSIDGADHDTADERSDEAQSGGVWTNQSLWVVTAADSVALDLNENVGGLVLHGPDDYTALPEPSASLLLFAALLTTAAQLRGRR